MILCCLSISDFIYASNITITPTNVTHYTVYVGDYKVRTYTYDFKISNNLPAVVVQGLTLRKFVLNSAKLLNVKLKSTNCPFGSTVDFLTPRGTPGSSCTITLESSAPSSAGKFTQTFSIYDGLGGMTSSPTFGITLENTGYFAFKQANKIVQHLDLTAAEQGEISIFNTGMKDIDDFKVTIPSQIMDYFTADDCLTKKTLAKNSSCTLNYKIPSANVKTGTYKIMVFGVNAANDPHLLNIDIATLGHFVFRKDEQDVSAINLSQGNHGVIELYNTGGKDIEDFKLTIPYVLRPLTIC